MKKYFNIILVCLLFITGCGKKETSVEVLNKVLTNETESSSVTVKASIDFEMEQDGMNIDLPLSLTMKVDTENGKNGNMMFELADNPFIGKLEMYANIKEEEMTMYMPSSIIDLMVGLENTENKWIIQKETIEKEEETEFSLDEYKKEVSKIMEVVKEDDFVFIEKTDGTSHYQLKITADLVKRILEKMEEEYDSSLDEMLKEEIVLDMYIKDYMITKIEFDMTKVLKSISEEIEEDSFDMQAIKKLTLSVEAVDYDKTIVTIPEEVKNQAITSEEYLRLYIGEE